MLLKKIIVFIFILFFSMSLKANTHGKSYASGEVLVKFDYNIISMADGKTKALLPETRIHSLKIKKFLENFKVDSIFKVVPEAVPGDTLMFLENGLEIKIPDFSQLYKITFPKWIPVDLVINKLKVMSEVKYAEPNYIFYPNIDPNDDFYEQGELWHLKQASDEDIDADLAWDLSKGDGIKIAIMDWGVRTTHNDLDNKILGGETTQSDRHGTMVAGVAAAETNNNFLTSGVAWNSKIIPYDFGGETDELVSDMYSAVSEGADIINMSFGSEYYSQSFKDVLDYTLSHGVILVGSAGNTFGSAGSEPPFTNLPASFNNEVIAVTATDRYGNFVSNYNYGGFVDVCAPGKSIYTLDWDSDDDSAVVSGTSFSAPIVSGIVALLKSFNPDLIDRDFERIIELSAEDKGEQGWDNKYGYGRVNAYKALQLVTEPNKIFHQTANGGYVFNDVSGIWIFYDLPNGAPNGVYYVGERYEVRRQVNFGKEFKEPPEVWGRYTGTKGYSSSSKNYSIFYCEPVPGTITTIGATLRTYVYEINTLSGEYYGWYPCKPNEVSLAYTVLGELKPLSVTITGPTSLNSGQSGTYTAHPSGGSGTYTNYEWWEKRNDDVPMAPAGGNGILAPPSNQWVYLTGGADKQQITISRTYSFSLKCIVTDSDGDQATSNILSVNVSGGALAKQSSDQTPALVVQIPEKVELTGNFPNPFNPTTSIKFGLPEDGHVCLTIYAIDGQKVRTLLDGQVSKGYHQVVWDGTNESGQPVSGGLYFYELKTEHKRILKKMLLVK